MSLPVTRKIWLLLLGVLLVTLFLGARVASAQENALEEVSIGEGGNLMNEGNFIESDTDYAWVPTGWTIIRQMSNVLVLVFLFIASAATTLNLQVGTYGVKRMLPSVITGTVLANMSREISNILLSIEFTIRNGLISMTDGNATTLWGNLAAPVRMALDTIEPTQEISSILSGIIFLLLSVAGLIALLLLVLLFIVRKLFLGFLIVLAPIAFLTMAAPFSQGVFRKWWGEYIKWLFLPTISVFFITIGAIIVFAIAGAGAFSLIAFIAALGSIYLAIKVPFMMGGMLGAAAGFISANTWGRAKGAIGETAQIAALQTPGVGHAMRYFNQKSINRKNTLEGLRKRPVATSTKLRDRRIANDTTADPRLRQAAQRRLNSKYHQFRNWAAENFERSTIVASNQGAHAEAMAKQNRAAALDRYSRAGSRGGQLNRQLKDTEITDIEAQAAEKALLAAGLTTGLAARKIFAEIDEQRAGTREKVGENSAYRSDRRLMNNKLSADVDDKEADTDKKESTLWAQQNDPILRERMAAAGLSEETADSEIEQEKLDADNEYRREHEGLALALATSQEAVAALKDNLEGFNTTMKTSALKTNDMLKAMRRQATLSKELGSSGYAEQLAEVKEQIRETSTITPAGGYTNDVTRQLETDPGLRRQVELMLGPNYGDAGSVMKSALVRLGGRKAMLEENVASMEKSERKVYQASVSAGISALDSSFKDSGYKKLIDHTMDRDEFASKFRDARGAAYQIDPSDTRIDDAIERLGIGHLSDVEKIDYLHDYLGEGRKDLRKTTMRNATKVLGESEHDSQSLMRKDASLETVAGIVEGDRAKAALAFKIMEAGGSYTTEGSRLVEALGSNNRERQILLDEANGALARTHESVERLASLRDDVSAAQMLDTSGAHSWINSMNGFLEDIGQAGKRLEAGTKLAGMQFKDAAGVDHELTVGIAHQLMTGGLQGSILGKNGRRLTNPNDARAAIQGAVKSHLAPVIYLDRSVVDNTRSAVA